MPKVFDNKWGWLIKGFPVLARAKALFQVRNQTMTSFKRSKLLWDESCRVIIEKIPGCFVECGVWRGGSSAIMGLANRHFGQKRELHLFDSFEGLPEPTRIDGEEAIKYSGGRFSGELKSFNECKVELDKVQSFLFGKLRLNQSKTHFHVGWFQNTVPTVASSLGPIALLRLDGDWYESTRVCLEHLYPLLSIGGTIIIDDYFAWEGCRKATDEFRAKHDIFVPVKRIDNDSAYWIRETN